MEEHERRKKNNIESELDIVCLLPSMNLEGARMVGTPPGLWQSCQITSGPLQPASPEAPIWGLLALKTASYRGIVWGIQLQTKSLSIYCLWSTAKMAEIIPCCIGCCFVSTPVWVKQYISIVTVSRTKYNMRSFPDLLVQAKEKGVTSTFRSLVTVP